MQQWLHGTWEICCKNRGSEKSNEIFGAADVFIHIHKGFE